MLAEGREVADVCRELQVSEQTYCRWRNQFGGLKNLFYFDASP
jgi:transposase-like protein